MFGRCRWYPVPPFAILVVLLVSQSPLLAAIAFDAWNIETFAREGSTQFFARTIDSTISLPFTPTRSVVHHPNLQFGESSNQTTYNFAGGGDNYALNWSAVHVRSSLESSYTSTRGSFRLTPSNDVQYQFSGQYQFVRTGFIHVEVIFTDLATNQRPFNYFTTSFDNPNTSFALEDPQGLVGGAPSGTLLAGHTYSLAYEYEIDNRPSPIPSTGPGAGNATGQFSLILTPEPATWLMIFVGSVGCHRRMRTSRRLA